MFKLRDIIKIYRLAFILVKYTLKETFKGNKRKYLINKKKGQKLISNPSIFKIKFIFFLFLFKQLSQNVNL